MRVNAGGCIRRVFADGAYDGQPSYDAIYDASPPKLKPKAIINPREPSIPDKGGLTARTFGAQQAEVAIKIAIADKYIPAARPVMVSVR